ncbi:Na+/H+ antiporter family protein [Priestia taiwanensis]|uniref:Sodium:proton antiporter n=1 Tax=Priestia taiwanensis TaxID=1347902 RepID=A0A917EPJ9_9BACI|nr:Na+/H+ antiporter family protein [Priestia taiwanensis]MBM7362490.1 putative histidine transporter YuiF (NhaC family) [Priestia taiwanensis]GGE62636.1 sodium:proton antiporter [Priestia taiwanensis]
MNAIVVAIFTMLALSLLRVHVVVSLLVGAIIGGLVGGLGLHQTVEIFTQNVGSNANIALNYALLGSFAVCLSKTALPDALIQGALKVVKKDGDSKKKAYSKVLLVLVILFVSCSSQNLIPIHIAFIPIFIPPLLKVLNELEVDRRLIAVVITFGLVTPYMWVPAGFGKIFHDIIQTNLRENGMLITSQSIVEAMTIPSLGMIVGLCVAAFITYRKPRQYKDNQEMKDKPAEVTYSKLNVVFATLSVITTVVAQLLTDSMIFGALSGVIILIITGCVKFSEADKTITDGMRMMSFIGFVMLSAAGFSAVLRETGHIESLVTSSTAIIGDNKILAATLMLIIGLLITLGIGSSFSTIPIIAAVFVPLCMQLGFSELATIALIGTAGALGDAGSPASDSTLGPTAGLNVDGQHNHIWDTCVPTFLHYNIPLIIFGVIAAITL